MKRILIMQLMSLGHHAERPLNFSGAPESDRCGIYCDSPLITIKEHSRLAVAVGSQRGPSRSNWAQWRHCIKPGQWAVQVSLAHILPWLESSFLTRWRPHWKTDDSDSAVRQSLHDVTRHCAKTCNRTLWFLVRTKEGEIIIIISNLSNDRSKASCKTVPPHSAIYSFLLQFTVSSPVLKVVQ